jgi:HSP20 family protein
MNSLFPLTRIGSRHNIDSHGFESVLENLIGKSFVRPARQINLLTTPLANVRKFDEGYTIDLAAPGLSRDDFNISVEGNTLTITSALEDGSDTEPGNFTATEYSYGSFQRSWTLPESVHAAGITARYEAGILSIDVIVDEKSEERVVINVE